MVMVEAAVVTERERREVGGSRHGANREAQRTPGFRKRHTVKTVSTESTNEKNFLSKVQCEC